MMKGDFYNQCLLTIFIDIDLIFTSAAESRQDLLAVKHCFIQ